MDAQDYEKLIAPDSIRIGTYKEKGKNEVPQFIFNYKNLGKRGNVSMPINTESVFYYVLFSLEKNQFDQEVIDTIKKHGPDLTDFYSRLEKIIGGRTGHQFTSDFRILKKRNSGLGEIDIILN